MRTIKFRGKRFDNGEWVYGSLIISTVMEVNHYHIQQENTAGHRYCYPVNHETVGQLMCKVKKDNGDIYEIYEGDLIIHGERILKVVCLNGNTILTDKGNRTAILLSFNNGKKKLAMFTMMQIR